jgi:hypothetical protein
MTYQYKLKQKDVEKLGFEFNSKARKYFALQNGWNGEFEGVYMTILIDGMRYDKEVIEGQRMSERQKEYIVKRCESIG